MTKSLERRTTGGSRVCKLPSVPENMAPPKKKKKPLISEKGTFAEQGNMHPVPFLAEKGYFFSVFRTKKKIQHLKGLQQLTTLSLLLIIRTYKITVTERS